MYYVYIMSNQSNRVVYIGVTSDLKKRVHEHKTGVYEGFTKKYKVDKLVYYDSTTDVYSAITREKKLKGWKRERKNKLIEEKNPKWEDLSKNF